MNKIILIIFIILLLLSTNSCLKTTNKQHLLAPIDGECVFGFGMNINSDGTQNCKICQEYDERCTKCQFQDDNFVNCLQNIDDYGGEFTIINLTGNDALFCGENVATCEIQFMYGLREYDIFNCSNQQGDIIQYYHYWDNYGGYKQICLDCQNFDSYHNFNTGEEVYQCIEECQTGYQQGEVYFSILGTSIKQCIQCDTQLNEYYNQHGDRIQYCPIKCQQGQQMGMKYNETEQKIEIQCLLCSTFLQEVIRKDILILESICTEECLSGEILGNTFNAVYDNFKQCIKCDTHLHRNYSQDKDIYIDQCHEKCPQGSCEKIIHHDYDKMEQICIDCPINCLSCFYVYNLEQSDIFLRLNNNDLTNIIVEDYSVQCIECVQGKHWNSFENQCVDNPLNALSCYSITYRDYISKQGFCECQQGFYYDPTTQKCIQDIKNIETCLIVSQTQYYEQKQHIYMPPQNYFYQEKCIDYEFYEKQHIYPINHRDVGYQGSYQNQDQQHDAMQQMEYFDNFNSYFNKYNDWQKIFDYPKENKYHAYFNYGIQNIIYSQYYHYGYYNDIITQCTDQLQFYNIQEYIKQFEYNSIDGKLSELNQSYVSKQEQILLNYLNELDYDLAKDITYFNNDPQLQYLQQYQSNSAQSNYQKTFDKQQRLSEKYYLNLQEENSIKNHIEAKNQSVKLKLNDRLCQCISNQFWNQFTSQCEQLPLNALQCKAQSYRIQYFYLNYQVQDGEFYYNYDTVNCKCLQGYYFDGNSRQCLQISQGASECKSIPILDFNNGSINASYYNNYCSCKVGYYKDSNNHCQQCPSGCSDCKMIEIEGQQYQGVQCLSCSAGQIWNPLKNLCVQELSQCQQSYFNLHSMEIECRYCVIQQYQVKNNCCPQGCTECNLNSDGISVQCTKCSDSRRFNDPSNNCQDDGSTGNQVVNGSTVDSGYVAGGTGDTQNAQDPLGDVNDPQNNNLLACLTGLENLVSGVIQQNIVSTGDNYEISLLYDDSIFQLNLNCFTQSIYIGSTQITDYDQNDQKGMKITIQANTIDTDYQGCITESDGTVYCIVKLAIFYNNIEQHLYSFNLYSNLITKTVQFSTVATLETGIDTTNPNSVQSQIEFCTDFTCNQISSNNTFLRGEEFYFQLILTQQQHSNIHISHYGLKIGEFPVSIPAVDINSNNSGKIIYRTRFQLALGLTELSLTVKLNGSIRNRRVLIRGLQDTSQQDSEQDYGLNPNTQIVFLDEENYKAYLIEQSLKQNNNKNANDQNQEKINTQEEAQFQQGELIVLIVGINVGVIIFLGFSGLGFYKCYQKRRNNSNQSKSDKYKEKESNEKRQNSKDKNTENLSSLRRDSQTLNLKNNNLDTKE